MVVLAVPVSADEQAWGQNSGASMAAKIRDLKEMQHQNALEWQRKHVKQNWAQKLNGTYSNERVVDTTAQTGQNFSKPANFSNLAGMRGQGAKGSNYAAPTLFGPRDGGDFKRLSKDFNTNDTFKPQSSKLGLNLGSSGGSSLHSDKQGLKIETQGFKPLPGFQTEQGGKPGFSQNYGGEIDPTAQ
jgi:hypothetical protein